MKNRHIFGIAASLLVVGVAHGAILVAEPDAFPAGTNISNAFPGIALISVGAGYDGDFDPVIYSVLSASGGEPFTASTGTRVFGTNDSSFPNSFGGFGNAVLRVDFSQPTSLVMLDAIGTDSSDFARLEAFSAANLSLGVYNTALMGTNGVETMTVSDGGSQIAYVLASGVSGDSVGFDYLRFEGVPEPATALLALVGAAAFAVARRR